MNDKLETYRRADAPLPSKYFLWPLYGAGLENLGQDGKPILVETPTRIGADELLIRHDACGLCFSDIKVINQGQNHPRIFRDMKKEPIVLGHEVAMTVLAVGENLRGMYKVGDRLTLETDISVRGKMLAYGYWFQGGLSQYSVIGPDIIQSDTGNNLIPVQADRGYAEVALTEPWACVVAAYRLEYRTGIKPGGVLWIIGGGDERNFTITSGFDEKNHPARIFLSNVPSDLENFIRIRANQLHVEVVDVPDLENPPEEFVDDIVILGAHPDLIEMTSPRLAQFGVMVLMADKPLPRKINVDVGRIHYHRWVYVGSTSLDISAAYMEVPVRSALKPGGNALFVGAGGPMGRMHVQRAIQFSNGPKVIVAVDVSDERLEDLRVSFENEAVMKGVEFVCLNPTRKEEYAAGMERFRSCGFDDVVVLAPVPAVIADSATWLAEKGVMNVFAGVARGTMAPLDLSDAYMKQTRVIGHSASLMSDFELVIDKTDIGELSPNRSLAAVGSLTAAIEGLKAVKDATLPGKVVIYPHIKELPLTTLPEMKEKLPSVYALLKDGREWTNEAEAEFLRLMLP